VRSFYKRVQNAKPQSRNPEPVTVNSKYEQVADDAKVWDVYAEYLQRRGHQSTEHFTQNLAQ